MPVMIGSPRCG
jgi:hypothetical protein